MNLLKAEFTKVRSVRSTVWTIIAMTGLTVGMSFLATLVYRLDWNHLTDADRAQVASDAVGLILQPAMIFTQVAVCVLAALIISAEHSSGTISATMLASPKRRSVLWAKAATLIGIVFVAGELLAFVAFFVGRSVLSKYVDVSLGDPGVLGVIAMYGVYLCVVAIFVLGLATLVRHTAGAVTIAIATVLILPTVISMIPGNVASKIAAALPASGNAQMVLSTESAHAYYPMSAEAAFGVFVAWAVVAFGLGLVAITRRDV